MAAYGNPRIKTPALNKLASQGVVFEKAYVTQPVCTPSRSSAMTGLWPHQSGCIHNNLPLQEETRCLPELVNDPDYRCAYMGKWHLGDEIFAQHGFNEWVSIEDGYNPYYSSHRDRDKRSDYHRFLIEQGYTPDVQESNMFSREFACRRPIDQCKPAFLERKACDFLRRNHKHPFILYVNFLEPHMPFFGPLDALHPPGEVLLPANFSDILEENEPLKYRLAQEVCRRKYGKDEPSIRRLLARYWGLCSQVDRSVGRILTTLDQLQLAQNTIVVFTSDHGDMMGSHGLVEKEYVYEESVRVPWLLRIPQMSNQQRVVRDPVSNIDMVPTLLELMGVDSPTDLPGQSLVPMIGSGTAGRDVFIEWHSWFVRHIENTELAGEEQLEQLKHNQYRAVVTPDGWKLSLDTFDKNQLFHLAKDPGEKINLFDSPQHRGVIKRLAEKIHRWQKSVGDNVKVNWS
jgi:arylsulfatase A-like enzyme